MEVSNAKALRMITEGWLVESIKSGDTIGYGDCEDHPNKIFQPCWFGIKETWPEEPPYLDHWREGASEQSASKEDFEGM
jgi:hypothetical protein